MAPEKPTRYIATAIIATQLLTALLERSALAFPSFRSAKSSTLSISTSTQYTARATNFAHNHHLYQSRYERPCNDDTEYHSFNYYNGHGVNDRQKTMHSRRYFNKQLLATPAILSSLSSQPKNCNAISPQEASRTYDIYASTYDDLDGGSIASSLGIDDARNKLLSLARGNVLEVGVGTGLNLRSYRYCSSPPPNDSDAGKANISNNNIDDCVTSITLVDISEQMLLQAQSKITSLQNKEIIPKHIPIKIIQADATTQLTQLFGENKFDTVVDTFSLCVMGNDGARKCLGQLASVVKERKDRGQILLIENTRAENPALGLYQDVTARVAADMGGKGCLYNQNVGQIIGETKGLQVLREEKFSGGVFRSFVGVKES